MLSPRAAGRAASSQADAYLGGDDSVVRAPVRDVGLSARRGLAVAHVHGPAVHTVFLPSTLRGKSGQSGPWGGGVRGLPGVWLGCRSVLGPGEGWAPLQGRAPHPCPPIGPSRGKCSNLRPAHQRSGLSSHQHPQQESRGAFKAGGQWKCHRAGPFKTRK